MGKTTKAFIVAIAVMGIVRFILDAHHRKEGWASD